MHANTVKAPAATSGANDGDAIGFGQSSRRRPLAEERHVVSTDEDCEDDVRLASLDFLDGRAEIGNVEREEFLRNHLAAALFRVGLDPIRVNPQVIVVCADHINPCPIAERVDALVIAGDLYDGDQTSMKTARFLASQMTRLDQAGVRVYMIRGNHDTMSQITKQLVLPVAVTIFGGRCQSVIQRGAGVSRSPSRAGAIPGDYEIARPWCPPWQGRSGLEQFIDDVLARGVDLVTARLKVGATQ